MPPFHLAQAQTFALQQGHAQETPLEIAPVDMHRVYVHTDMTV